MEVQKITIRRAADSLTGNTWSLPCSGGTNYYPINLSFNCSGITMYNSTGSQVMEALDSCVMSSFPEELRDCSPTNPCIILWDDPLGIHPDTCTSETGYPYVIFKGLIYDDNPTFTTGSYNELITIYDITQSDINICLAAQGVSGHWEVLPELCRCDDLLNDILYKIPLTLNQDFNDIGHYSVWDGLIDQQQVFSNFVFTANTTGNGYKIQITNTTPFGNYKSLKESSYTINWGECPCGGVNTVPPFYPCCETLSYPTLMSTYEYANTPAYHQITVTHDAPWGPTSVSRFVHVPNLTYNQILAQPFLATPAPDPGTGMGGAALGAGAALSPTTPGGDPYQVNIDGNLTVNPFPAVNLPPLFTSTAYHGTYGTIGTPNYYPLDSGTHINQYTGTTPFPCFEVTGITESSVGIFVTYSNAPSSNPDLPPGFEPNVVVPVGGDVVDPITNTITPGMTGMITWADPQYTGYTISSANGNTPIQFYDFTNGITIFVATSCGLNSLAFGGEDCFECPENFCEACLVLDEYIDRVTLLPTPITPIPPPIGIQPIWSAFVDYSVGDIVYDVSPSDCCCYIAVTEIIQVGSTPDIYAGIKPSQLYQGIYVNPTGTNTHVWEACTPDCVSCPTGSALPCQDPYNIFNAYPTMGPPGPAGIWANGQTFSTGEFIFGQDGNCYRALQNVPSGIVPTASTNNMYWDYIGCASWICPQDLTNVGPDICELISGSTPDSFMFYAGPGGCVTAYNDGECPVEDRWHCEHPYQCEMPGCESIDYNHPEYNNIGYPYAVTFSSMTDCEEWCNPIAWSCTTPTQSPCCEEISCAVMNPVDYYDIMTTYILPTPVMPFPGPPNTLLTATNNLLFLHPDYDQDDCNLGVGGYTGCCDFTGWGYICDQGCVQYAGGSYSTQAACNNAPGNNNGLPGPCGWICYDPWYTPCSGGNGVMGSSACIPCYTPYCGYATSGECCTQCQPDPEDCWMCLSASSTPCQSQNPCTTPIPAWYTQWTIDPALVPLSGYGPNDIDFPNTAYPTFGPTYATAILCDNNCITSGGTDCIVNTQPPYNTYPLGCMNWPNAVALPAGYTWSVGGPYASYIECCDATGCCDIMCDEDDPIFNPASAQYLPAWPYWPCVYVPVIGANPPPSPTGPVFATFAQCVSYNSTGCDPGITCECACDALLGGNTPPSIPPFPSGNDSEWEPTGTGYDMYDVVAWQLGQAHTCCYMCNCPTGSNITTGPPDYARDCNYFEPGSGDDTDGLPNCWLSCDLTPSGNPTNFPQYQCDPCTHPSGDTYSCYYGDPGNPIGCQLNAIPCVYPGLALQTAQNCYTASTCEDECKAGCYCDDQGTPTTADDFTACVMLQDFLNGVTTWSSTVYFYPSQFLCDQAILLPPPFNLDCCDPLDNRWWCDDSEPCSSNANSPCIPPDGCGCIEVTSSHAQWSTAYLDYNTCVDNCKWACEPGVNGSACHFVANNPLGYTPWHSSAYDCWQNETTPSHCYCVTNATAWFCDTNPGQSATTSNCFSQVTIDSWVAIPPFPGWTPNLVYGQQGTTTPYPMSPTAFASQTDCQAACRFCCDQTVTCTCDLVPYDFNCHIAIGDCITWNQGQTLGYPCCPTYTWYCCHETDGCISYTTLNPTGLPMPVGCMTLNGPFTSPAQCQDHCYFLCGECPVDIGPAMQPDPCHCDVMNFDIVAGGFNCPLYYNTMALCETASYNQPLVLEDGPSCCPCHECLTTGSVTFPIVDNNVWSFVTVNVTPPISGNILQADPYDINVAYSQGDVVTESGCCWVNVTNGTPYPTPPVLTPPSEFYNIYANMLMASTSPHTVKDVIWIPCDINCPTTASTLMYECVPGQPIFTSICTAAVLEYPINPIGPSNSFGSWGITAAFAGGATLFGKIVIDWYQQTYGPNKPFWDAVYINPGTPNFSCANNDPNIYGGLGQYVRPWPNCHFTNTIYLPANGCHSSSPTTTDTWGTLIDGLNAVNTSQGWPTNFTYSMTWHEAQQEMSANQFGDILFISTTFCSCTQYGPCYCQACMGGANCIYPTLTGPTGCNVAANANPCCQPAPPTGFWVCDTQNPNLGTGICPCIWDAAATAGYTTQALCTADTNTCCFVSPPDPWKCIDTSGGTQTSAQSDCGQNKIYAGGWGTHIQALNGIRNVAVTNGTPHALWESFWFSNYGTQWTQPCPTTNGTTYIVCPSGPAPGNYSSEYFTFVNIGQPGGPASLYNQNGFLSWGDMIDHINSVNATQGWTWLSNYNDDIVTTYIKMSFNEGTSWSGGDFWPTDGYEWCWCHCACYCTQDPLGTHANQSACEFATNCCSASTGTIVGWDCIINNQPCVPVYSPNTAQFTIAFYGSSSAAQLACDTFCSPISPIYDCGDCENTLGPGGTNQLQSGVSTQMGDWVNTLTYQLDECVFDTSTANATIVGGCCYCCVLYPGSTGGGCDAGFTPSLHVNINIGGAMWAPCGYDAGGNQVQSCIPVLDTQCDDCSLDLQYYFPIGTTVSFPHQPPIWGTGMLFQLGECIYDVDPWNVGESCCWCCGCPAGWNQGDNKCNDLGSNAQAPTQSLGTAGSVGTSSGIPSMGGLPQTAPVPTPCSIDSFGNFSNNSSLYNSGWIPCGYDSTGAQCNDTVSSQNN